MNPAKLGAMETLVELIAKKRDGGRLVRGQIARIVRAHSDGELADYQMAALLMAIFFRGMDDAETVALTDAMLHSGDVLDLSSVPGVKVDKHSTGGVGDKVSICLAPLVAALRRARADGVGPRPRPHRRHARQARGDPRVRRRARRRRVRAHRARGGGVA